MSASHLQTVGAVESNPTTTLSMAAYTSGSRLFAFCAGRNIHISRSGWTHLGDLDIAGTGPDRLCGIWKASAGEPTSLGITTSQAGSGRVWCSEILGGDPIQTGTLNNTTSAGQETITLTGVTAGSLVLGAACGSAADAWAGGGWAQSAGFTEVEDGSGGGHPYSNGAYKVSSGGSESWTPDHANDWSGWSPRGEAMYLLEIPDSAGGGGGPTARIINSFRRTLWAIEKPKLWVPRREVVLPGLQTVGFSI